MSRGSLAQTLRDAWILMAVALVITAVVLSGLYLWWVFADEEDYYTCGYTLLAESDSDEVFTLYVPIPADYSGGRFADIPGQGVFTGALTMEIEETQYGVALKVTGRTALAVNWTSNSFGEADLGYFSGITMNDGSVNATTGLSSTWVFSDDPGVSVNLTYSAGFRIHETPTFDSGQSRSYEIAMEPGTEGWRLVPSQTSFLLLN